MAEVVKIKRTWIYAGLTVLVLIYLVTMSIISWRLTDARKCAGVRITVHDTALYKFVTPRELALELGDLPRKAKTMRLRDINVDSIERMLAAFDKIERVNVTILSNDTLYIDVHPLHPAARIFDNDGKSYYINRTGKRIKADARYHIDVPVIQGNFSDAMPATSLLPLLDRIADDSLMNSLVSMIKVDSPNDIILVPVIRGHVINLGDTLDYADKFRRLKAMYRNVLNVRGWELYDTISVKWGGQVVASRRNKAIAAPQLVVETVNGEDVDLSTMMSGPNVAPGQALPNKPAKNEKTIPARKGEPARQSADTAGRATSAATPPSGSAAAKSTD